MLQRTRYVVVLLMILIPGVIWGGKIKNVPILHPDPQAVSWFGRSTISISDIDGDRIREIVVGAPQLIPMNGTEREGVVFVFSGVGQRLLFTLTNPRQQSGAFFGDLVTSIGDIDSDGLPDIAVGIRLQDVDGKSAEGQVVLYSGANGAVIDIISSPVSQEDAWFGAALDNPGDIDDDGVADLWVGAPKQDIDGTTDAGAVYLFSGRTGDILLSLTDPSPQTHASFGTALHTIADINGDKISDIVVGTPFPVLGQTENARAYVFSGADGQLLYMINGEASVSSGALGSAVEVTDDLDGDDIQDIVLGAPAADGTDRNQGRVFVYSGSDGSFIRFLDDPTPLENGTFGAALSMMGDIDGDGIPDILVGAPAILSENSGEVFLFSGDTGELLATIDNPSQDAGASFGLAIATVGDIDGDGRPDVMIGAPFHNVPTDGGERPAQGEVFLFRAIAPDLKGTIRDIQRSIESPSQEVVTFTVSIKNKGTIQSTVPFKVKVHVSVDEVFDGGKADPKVLKWNVQPPLRPGEQREIVGEIELDSATPGNFLIIRVDTKDVIAERKEQNNVKAIQIPN